MSTKYIASNWRLPNKAGVDSYKNDNYGLTFDGTEYINAGNSLNIITSNYSFSIWLKFTSTQNRVVCEKGSNDELALQIGGGGYEGKISWIGGADYRVFIDETINDGNWHNVVCVADGSVSRMYLDGVLKTIGGNKIQASSNTSDFHIGSRSGSIGLIGSISQLTLFDYALSDGGVSVGETAGGQISTLYGSSSLGSASPLALKPAPVAYYPLGDNSASNPLTQPNEAVEDASVFDFDGSSTYVDLGSSIDLGTTNTISVWVKNKVSQDRVLLGEDSYGSDFAIFGGYTYFLIKVLNSFMFFTTSTPIIPINSDWAHIAFVRDGDNISFYINGSLIGSSSTWTGGSPGSTTTKFDTIGAKTNGAGTSNWLGEISNLAAFNTALDSTEISNIYNSGVPATTYTNTPTAWYKLDQSANWDVSGSGNWTIPDASGNGNDGTSSGMTSANLVLSDLTRAVPYDSYSFNFDSASSDYIDCGDIGFYSPQVSFSCWIYPTNNGQFIAYGSHSSGPLLWVFVHNTTDLRIYVRNVYRVFSSCITLNQWHHIVISRTDYNNGKVYVNGISQGDLIATGTDISQNGNLLIGSSFNGLINNFSVFNEALTSTEVLKLYSNGVPQDLTNFTPQPVAWYPLGSNSFWNGSQWTVRDMSTGGSNDGTGQNIGVDGLVGDAPRSEANGTGTNMDIPTNLEGSTKWSDNNSWSINMSSTARVEDTP